jgi:hypothetical protein
VHFALIAINNKHTNIYSKEKQQKQTKQTTTKTETSENKQTNKNRKKTGNVFLTFYNIL